jgi:hypothetical protein
LDKENKMTVTDVTPDRTTVEKFRSVLSGALLQPGDPVYDQARQVYNGMFDKHPALIVRCENVSDVIQSVNFARQHSLPLSVRGGGHHAAGLGVVDDGLVIDLTSMRRVQVDSQARTARVEGGCTLGDVDSATHAFGLTAPFGINSTTGVAGLTLGGGLGYLTRKLGLSIDNLLAVDLVLADGRPVTASADEHPDLFWAVRGGGGNFGVVTSFLFRLHPVDTVYAGPMLWAMDQAADVLRFFDNLMRKGPEDLSGFFAFLTVPPGPPFPEHLHNRIMCGVVWCYAGALAQAEEVFTPIRQFGPPALDLVGPLPYPALQSLFDPLYPKGMQWYWKADFVNQLSDEAIALHVKHGAQLPTPLSTMHLYPINGAAHRVGKNETAWSYRDAVYGEVIVGVDPDPANAERVTVWARDYWSALHPYSAGGAYVNMMMEEGDDRVKAAYRDNYARLAAVKSKYDPHNLFRVNQNIIPQAR